MSALHTAPSQCSSGLVRYHSDRVSELFNYVVSNFHEGDIAELVACLLSVVNPNNVFNNTDTRQVIYRFCDRSNEHFRSQLRTVLSKKRIAPEPEQEAGSSASYKKLKRTQPILAPELDVEDVVVGAQEYLRGCPEETQKKLTGKLESIMAAETEEPPSFTEIWTSSFQDAIRYRGSDRVGRLRSIELALKRQSRSNRIVKRILGIFYVLEWEGAEVPSVLCKNQILYGIGATAVRVIHRWGLHRAFRPPYDDGDHWSLRISVSNMACLHGLWLGKRADLSLEERTKRETVDARWEVFSHQLIRSLFSPTEEDGVESANAIRSTYGNATSLYKVLIGEKVSLVENKTLCKVVRGTYEVPERAINHVLATPRRITQAGSEEVHSSRGDANHNEAEEATSESQSTHTARDGEECSHQANGPGSSVGPPNGADSSVNVQPRPPEQPQNEQYRANTRDFNAAPDPTTEPNEDIAYSRVHDDSIQFQRNDITVHGEFFSEYLAHMAASEAFHPQSCISYQRSDNSKRGYVTTQHPLQGAGDTQAGESVQGESRESSSNVLDQSVYATFVSEWKDNRHDPKFFQRYLDTIRAANPSCRQ